jgi:hypothetical protein
MPFKSTTWNTFISPFSNSFTNTFFGLSYSSHLLNQYPGASAAYSLQNIGGGGNVIRARRSSDNSEDNFSATDITGGALATFAGAGDAFVTTWYDQSGNGQNATQTTASAQPKIVNSGSVITNSNGKATVSFDGSGDYLQMPFATGSNSGHLMSAVCEPVNNTTNQFLLDFRDASNDGITLLGLSSGLIHHRSNAVKAQQNYDADVQLFTGEYTGTDLTAYVDGAGGTTLTGANTNATTNGRIGSVSYGVTLTWNGTISEIVIYLTDQSANRADIESNIAGRHGITLP